MRAHSDKAKPDEVSQQKAKELSQKINVLRDMLKDGLENPDKLGTCTAMIRIKIVTIILSILIVQINTIFWETNCCIFFKQYICNVLFHIW